MDGRTPETVEATADALRALGVEAVPVVADVGCTEGVDALFAGTLRAYGTVDLLVNNAAYLRRAHMFEVDEEMLDRSLSSNVRGPYLCAHRAAAVMRDAGGGSIIHISSVGGLRAHWRGLPYDLTKGAIDAMTRAMALELAGHAGRDADRAHAAGRLCARLRDRGPCPDATLRYRDRDRVRGCFFGVGRRRVHHGPGPVR